VRINRISFFIYFWAERTVKKGRTTAEVILMSKDLTPGHAHALFRVFELKQKQAHIWISRWRVLPIR